ncbi:MAG: hypothetical protein ACJA2E_002461, partial [Arenicella sp.]
MEFDKIALRQVIESNRETRPWRIVI